MTDKSRTALRELMEAAQAAGSENVRKHSRAGRSRFPRAARRQIAVGNEVVERPIVAQLPLWEAMVVMTTISPDNGWVTYQVQYSLEDATRVQAELDPHITRHVSEETDEQGWTASEKWQGADEMLFTVGTRGAEKVPAEKRRF